ERKIDIEEKIDSDSDSRSFFFKDGIQ
ncbi:MAG: hypothetical protein ACI8RD_008009, partial [Bacillariaceae sp.]